MPRPIRLARRVKSLAAVSIRDEAPVEHDADSSLLAGIESALLSGETHYTVRPGMPELRRRIAQEIVRVGGPSPDAEDPAENVLVTSGESEALFVLLLSLSAEPGDVLTATAGVCNHVDLFHLMGFECRDVTAGAEVDARTRLVYRRWDADTRSQQLALEAARKKDIPDLLDLAGTLTSGSLRLPPVEPPRTVVIGNLDLLPGLATFRLGFMIGPRADMARIRPWKQALSICSAAPSQRAAVHALASRAMGSP